MKKRWNVSFSFLILLPTLLLAAGCEKAGEEPSEEEVARVTELGEKASDSLMKSLGGQLKAALQAGGPREALVICEQVAIPLTETASDGFDGVRISRTTMRPRNPENAPDAGDRAVLARLGKSVEEEQTPPAPVIEWTKDHAIYYRPLMIQEICLNCHGAVDSFPQELKLALTEKYPEDQATGYAPGDFRGVIRVEIDRD